MRWYKCDGISEGNIICAGSLQDLPQLALEFISAANTSAVFVCVLPEKRQKTTLLPNERTRWTCVSTRQWTWSLPAGLLSAMIRCFCHVKIVYSVYSWIWSPGCTDNFLILKEKQCLRNLFYFVQFYLENDKVKAHVGTSSPWALIWKWNVNFRWICVHPPPSFYFPHQVNFFS